MATSKITITGLVATTPRHIVTAEGLPITSFRLADSDGHISPADGKFKEHTNWYTITSFRQLGINTAGSVSKGERISVTGSLIIRDWDNGEQAGTSVEIEADSISHDLSYGNSAFTRNVLVREKFPALEPEPEIV
jgi:single-strand DNA-binding protein